MVYAMRVEQLMVKILFGLLKIFISVVLCVSVILIVNAILDVSIYLDLQKRLRKEREPDA